MGKIRIGIVGYGNIGRGVEQSIKRNDDMELKAVFTRRDPASVKIQTEGAEVKHFDDMEAMKDEIDVMILCGGSATDLPVIGPKVAASFNTIDSFDTHAKIPEYFANVDKAAKEGKNVSIISVGWDPGMFSLNRLYAESILVQGSTYTFWGKGVSQGHSDAIRRIEGVKNGIQYTVPIEAAVDQVRSGSEPELTTRQKHLRECYVVAEEGADKAAIEEAIKTMPNYFDEYDTTVTFIVKMIVRIVLLYLFQIISFQNRIHTAISVPDSVCYFYPCFLTLFFYQSLKSLFIICIGFIADN